MTPEQALNLAVESAYTQIKDRDLEPGSDRWTQHGSRHAQMLCHGVRWALLLMDAPAMEIYTDARIIQAYLTYRKKGPRR
jgi:hypothetical protein